MKFADQNVFQMAEAHGGAGFWVRRTTWGASIARVVRVGHFAGPVVLRDSLSPAEREQLLRLLEKVRAAVRPEEID